MLDPVFPSISAERMTFLRSAVQFGDTASMMSLASALRSHEPAEESTQVDPVQPENSSSPEENGPPLNFDQVYSEHFAFVWRVARRQGVATEHLDDVCQEVFIVVHRKLNEFEQRAKLKTWIYQIVTNVVRNQRRSVQRKSVHARSHGDVLDPDDIDGNHLGPEALARRHQAAQAARDILMEMSEKHRMAFVLIELEGMSLKEVADATEESFHTVRSRVRAARAEFQRHARRLRNVGDWRENGQ
jgi:RNA polymerase sigma-70 factor (ECF subfamily)